MQAPSKIRNQFALPFRSQLFALLVAAILWTSTGFGYNPYVPPPLPLSPFPTVTNEDLQEYALEVINVLGEATLPTSTEELLAIVVSETVAGFAGGGLERLVAFLIGDILRDSSFEQSTTTGTYFGIRGLVRSLSTLAGLPLPVSAAFADIAASVAAEILKVAERTYFDKSVQSTPPFEPDSNLDCNEETGFSLSSTKTNIPIENSQKPFITGPEIVQDIVKWVTYDLVLPADLPEVGPLDAIKFGAISGLAGNAIFEILNSRNDQHSSRMFVASSKRFFRAGIEGATLFASYEGTINFFHSIPTSELKQILMAKFIEF
eukprot:gene6028-8300_t